MTAIITDIRDGIFSIALNRPEKRNALNEVLIEELKSALRSADANSQIRAIVISGAGSDFCSGADLAALRKISESDAVENLEDARSLMELFTLIRNVKIPVIAAVHGRALAGGCGLATACDIVLAAESAKFGYPEVKIGFVPAMVMAILRRNLSEKRAFEIITRGFDFDATRAREIGLVNEVFADADFQEMALEYARGYAKISRSAVILSKRLLYQMDAMTFETAMETAPKLMPSRG